jgi:signal transduction histidine kinase
MTSGIIQSVGKDFKYLRLFFLVAAYLLPVQLFRLFFPYSELLLLLFVSVSAISLAFVLLYGPTMAWGLVLGQILFGLSLGLPFLQSFALALLGTAEILFFNWLIRHLKVKLDSPKQKDFWIASFLIVLSVVPSSALMAFCLFRGGIFSGSTYLGLSFVPAFLTILLANVLARTQLTPSLLWILTDCRRFLNRRVLRWVITVIPCLVGVLLLMAFLPGGSQGQGLGYKPVLFLVPLTVVIALRTNPFGLFCAYSYVNAISLLSLLFLNVGNFVFEDASLTSVLRVLANSWIGQAVNFTMCQLLESRDLASDRSVQLAHQLKISMMAASLTHEVKQPTAVIQMASRELNTAAPQERNVLIDSIMMAAEELSCSTAKVHALLRSIPAGLKPLNISTLLPIIVLKQKVQLDGAVVEVRILGAKDPHWILGDASQISLALSNIIRNSLDGFTCKPESSPRLLTLSLVSTLSAVELEISDSGPGFSSQDWKPELFKSTKPDGTGLGLYLVQQMVDNHKAKLFYGQSDLGGAQVKIIFPLLLDG